MRFARFAIVSFALVLFARTQPASRAGDKPAPDKKQPFTIGKETTRIMAPVDKEGFVDYAATLNDRLSAGVTKDNNAVVLLCRVFGPKPEGARVSPEFYKRLGIDEPPEDGTYFRGLDRFLDPERKRDREERNRLDDALDNATRRPWKAGEFPHFAAWLRAMEKPLALGVEATRREKYYYPLIPGRNEHGAMSLITCLVPHVQKNRELARALVL